MAERNEDRFAEAKMDAANLYREDIITDRRIGTIRVMAPIKSDGSPDTARKTLYTGDAQLMTSVGALPLSFEIEASSLEDAVAKYGPAAKRAFEQAMKELEEMRRHAASSIVVPKGGAGFGPGGMPGGIAGGGKIQIP